MIVFLAAILAEAGDYALSLWIGMRYFSTVSDSRYRPHALWVDNSPMVYTDFVRRAQASMGREVLV